MKHKKILLVVFFLTMFIAQQVQAGATIPSVKRPSQINMAPASAPFDHIWVWVFHLNPINGEVNDVPPVPCWNGDTSYGCGEVGSGGYQYPHNPEYIDIENDYLQDVLAREMDVAVNYPTLEALKAQALAARTVATWKAITPGQYYGQPNYINNSTDYQVFIPYSHEYYKNPNDPVAAQQIQNWISQAISETQGQYLSYNNTGETIDAEFGGDFVGQSTAEGSKSYLISIQDPISTTCAVNNYSGWGMSSAGAIRWSRGNQCATANGAAWPVIWSDYRQILVHYYTGIDILDASGTKVAPDDRWNLISHNIQLDANRMGNANAGEPYHFSITLQNTSTSGWNDSNTEIYYQWTAKGAAATGPWIKFEGFSVPATDKGHPLTEVHDLPITMPSSSGDYTLHLDLYRNGHWFSSQNLAWPDATIDIRVNGPTATSTNTSITPTSSGNPIAQGILPSQINGGAGFVTIPNLIPGMQYRIVISGVINYNSYISGDAQWNDYQRTYGCFCWYSPAINFNGIPLSAQNGQTVYDPNHTYTFLWLAGDTQLQMYIGDSYYGDNSGSLSYQIFEDVFIGTPTPSSLTATSTPQPTTCTKTCFWENCVSARLPAYAKTANLSKVFIFAIANLDRIEDQAALLYRVRDELLSTTEEGQRYIDLYYTHSTEIAAIMETHTDLAEQGLDVIDAFTPNLQALLNGQGDSVTITNEQVQQAQGFLDALLPYASSELQQDIASEKARTPLDQFIGKSMSQAWEELNGTFTFTPVADAYVNADSPTTNYGSSTTLRADASPVVRSYLRFNVQGLNGAVTRATLRVYANSASSQGYQVMGVSDNTWEESTINYNNTPSIGASLGSSGTFGAGVWTTVDVTSYITGNSVFNLALTTTSTTNINFASRESGANAPQLVIETGGPTATQTATFTPTVTATPTATPTSPFTPTPTPTATPSQTLTPTPPTPGSAFYLSLSGQATLAGVTAEDTDIFYYNGTAWSLFFDASDVGVVDSGNDLNDFYIVDADTILMSFRDPITLGSLAVDPYDVVQFDATSLGSTTAGTFSLYFDGSDVGLDDPVAEMLNGFDVLPDGRLLFSTDGNFTVPGLTGKDEDIFAFTPTTLGENTSGIWAMYFDGSLTGIGLGDTGEDVDMLDVASNGDIYLSAESTFAVPGISGEDEDIFVCTPTFTSGAVSSCTYPPTLFFDGSAWGLETNDVDALYLP